MLVVYNSKVAIIGGVESTVIVTKKFPGMFQVSESHELAVAYCSDIERLLLSSFPLIALITQGGRPRCPRSPFLTRIFSSLHKVQTSLLQQIVKSKNGCCSIERTDLY